MILNSRLLNIRQGDALPGAVRPVTQANINLYAEASGDFNPIHVDKDFAARTPLGGTIAHGMLILAYVAEAMTAAFGKSWYESGKLSARFKAPARPGDTITIKGRVEAVKDAADTRCITCSVEARNQAGEVVITGEAVVKNLNLSGEYGGTYEAK